MEEKTFSRRVKDELTLLINDQKALRPLLSGVVRVSGVLILGHEKKLKVTTEISELADLIFKAFETVYKVHPSYQYGNKTHFDKAPTYSVVIRENVFDILRDLECFDDLVRMKPKEMIKSSNFKYFVTGIFLGAGMISDPQKSQYYVELSFSDEEDAKSVLHKLLTFKGGKKMSFKMTTRRDRYILYLKKGEEISVLLAYIGATNMMMEFEDTRLTKDFFNSQNRLIICDAANYKKALKNGESNLADIDIIEKRVGLFSFDDKNKLAIQVRKDHPDASYNEISKIMTEEGGIPITKSGVVHIFKKLHEFAEKLRN